jgi:hypothetical protein
MAAREGVIALEASAACERVQRPFLYLKLFAVSTDFLIANTIFTQKEYF